MRGKTVFSRTEASAIRDILRAKESSDRGTQKRLRKQLRQRFNFYISDFRQSAYGFSRADFDDLCERGVIQILGEDIPPGEQEKDPICTSISKRTSDESYVLDLLDEVLRQPAIRQHRFPFLCGDAGTPLPVDGYYPALGLVVEYRERQHTESVAFFDRRQTVSGVSRGEQRRLYDQRRRDVLSAENVALLEISFADFSHDRRKRLLRQRFEDLKVVRRKLGPWIGDEG